MNFLDSIRIQTLLLPNVFSSLLSKYALVFLRQYCPIQSTQMMKIPLRQQVNSIPTILYCTSTHAYTPKSETCPPSELILRRQPFQVVHQRFLKVPFLSKHHTIPQLFPVLSIATQLCLLCNNTNNFMMRSQSLHITSLHSLRSYLNEITVEEHATLFRHTHQQIPLIPLFLITESVHPHLKILDLIVCPSTLRPSPQKSNYPILRVSP